MTMKVIWESSGNCIKKQITVDGNFTKKPTERSSCRVIIHDQDFTGELFSGSLYLTQLSKEIIIKIGDASYILDEYVERIIQTMFIKEECLIEITTREIQEFPTVTLGFKITLIDCDFCEPIWEWTAKKKYEIASSYKEVGVTLYKTEKIAEAFYKFSKACKILITLEPMEDQDVDETLRKDIDNLRKVLYNNMAECHLIRKNYDHAISLCDKVLARDENNVKALYRKALANESLKDYENALKLMEKVVALEPRNSTAKEKLVKYKKNVYEAQKKYDSIVKRMFA